MTSLYSTSLDYLISNVVSQFVMTENWQFIWLLFTYNQSEQVYDEKLIVQIEN